MHRLNILLALPLMAGFLIPGPVNASTGSFKDGPVSVSSSQLFEVPKEYAPTVGVDEIIAFIEAPAGPLSNPFVILSGYQSGTNATDTIQIKGTVNATEFSCSDSPCNLPVSGSSVVVFRAYSSSGKTSDEVQATVRVYLGTGGSYVNIDSLNQFFIFSDVCSNYWKVPSTNPVWAEFPQIPSGLDTNMQLHYLAGNLINSGIVNASDCPNGGLNNLAPNACGLDRASSAMIQWQNQYDFAIWSAAKNTRIPPKLIKTIIEIESQFWPTNQRLFVDEIGLGQINQLGLDTLLRRNPNLYHQACQDVLSDCSVPYSSLDPELQAMVRGDLLNSLNLACPSCEYGIDLKKANQSIPLLASVVEANCAQVKPLLDDFNSTASYEDSWKFTLASYHSGIGCLQTALNRTYKFHEAITWENVSNNFNCVGAKEYVDRFWNMLTSFDNYVMKPGTIPISNFAVFASAPTPTPLPPSTMSKSYVVVTVYYDKNGNGVPDESERLNGIPVEVTMANGTVLSSKTVYGIVFFDMRQFPVGMSGTVTLTGLYRSSDIVLPRQGIIPVVFKFTEPILPTVLP